MAWFILKDCLKILRVWLNTLNITGIITAVYLRFYVKTKMFIDWFLQIFMWKVTKIKPMYFSKEFGLELF